MSQFTKPDGLNIQWASAGDILDPGDTKYQTGWGVEIPPRQWENYIQNKQDGFIAHANQHGICVWDAVTEYQWTALGAKSLVMGSDGTIYRTLSTNINQDPTTTVGVHWEIAFSNAGDFYTKVEADALYLAKAQNLADLTNFTTARTNLSVYSQAQTYTKTEVDAKTTVASTVQAQELTSNITLMTPLRTKEAFNATGTAPFFATRAWANFDGLGAASIRASGNIATIVRTGAGLYTVTFTVNMPDVNYAVTGSGATSPSTGPGAQADTFTYFNRLVSGFTIQTFAADAGLADLGDISFMVVR